MEDVENNLCKQIIEIMENEKSSIEFNWLEIEEIITAIEQRIIMSHNMGATKLYLTSLQNLIKKLTKS